MRWKRNSCYNLGKVKIISKACILKNMRQYQLCLVLNPTQEKKEQEELLKKIQLEVEKLEGKIDKQEEWGKKELSYPIKRSREGNFFLLTLSLPPASVSNLERKMKLEERVIRYLLVKNEDLVKTAKRKKPSYTKASEGEGGEKSSAKQNV